MSVLALKRPLLGVLSLLFVCATVPMCSNSNHEGPLVTCADLECGRLNACQDGIIASCLDGVNVKYYVCYDNALDICDEDWQVPGQYRCEESMPDCTSCAPASPGCGGASDAGAGGGS